MKTHENQITDYPKGARIEAIREIPLCSPTQNYYADPLPQGTRGTVTAHTDDGRAWINFDGQGQGLLGHTFEQPEKYIRVVCTHRDDTCPANHEQPSKTEFDQVFDQMEAPEYPATCDNCGETGTNASMEQHECAEQPRPEQAGSEATRDDDECAFTHALPSGSVRCGALRQHHSQYTGHKFTEPETRRQHCGRPMRYDKISNGDVFNAQRLTGTYYCEQCCTMQPTYEAVNDAPAAPERGEWAIDPYSSCEVVQLDVAPPHLADRIAQTYGGSKEQRAQRAAQICYEHNQHSTLIAQRERLLRLLRPVTSPTACYCAVMGSEKCWHCEARELITAIEQDQIASRTTSEQEGRAQR